MFFFFSACGGVITEDAAVLLSPGYPGYRNNMRCFYYLQPEGDKTLSLIFQKFQLEGREGKAQLYNCSCLWISQIPWWIFIFRASSVYDVANYMLDLLSKSILYTALVETNRGFFKFSELQNVLQKNTI